MLWWSLVWHLAFYSNSSQHSVLSHILKKNSVKVMEDDFVRNLTQKLYFLEYNSYKYRKLPQKWLPISNFMHNLGNFSLHTLFVPICSCTTFEKSAIYLVKWTTRVHTLQLLVYTNASQKLVICNYRTPNIRATL